MTERNSTPQTPFELLKRIYACNWTQLAQRLGVSARTLRTWRDVEISPLGEQRLREALQVALTRSGLND